MLYRNSIINGRLVVMDQSGSPKIDFYVQPDETERKYLVENLKLDKHTLASALDPDEMPRIEIEKDYTAIILKCPQNHSEKDGFHFSVDSVGIFVLSPTYIVFIFNENISLTRYHGSRMGSSMEYLSTTQDVVLRVLSQTIRLFEISLKLIGKRKDELKKDIDKQQGHKSLTDMFILREGLIYYVDALRGNGHLIERISAVAGKLGFSPDNIENLKDYAIENQQFLEQAQVYSQVLTDLMDTCNSLINNNLNFIMKNMNSLVLAISIPTFFTSLGGMSEFTLMAAPYLKWYVSYPLFFFLMVLLAYLIYWLLQRYYRT